MSNINYCETVQKILTENNFKYNVKDTEKGVILTFGVSSKSLPCINYTLSVSKDGDTKLRSYVASKVDETKMGEMLELLNGLNTRFRFIVFNLDEDNDVCVTYDFALYGDEKTTSELVLDAIYIVSRIIDQSAPDIMQLNWKKDEDNTEFIDSDDIFGE